MQQFSPPRQNPLMQFMRQPKIYIRLPSGGEWWPTGSINWPESGELAVYSMTAKDELMFKTPDALMNGQAIVDVIQSCIPDIKNAWECPTVDLDTLLIAIRLATYGEKVTYKHNIPVIKEEVEYDIDLRMVLDQQANNRWINQISISPELSVFVKPLTYKHVTKTSIKSFETARIMNIANDDSIPDEKKIEMFNQSFASLTNATIDLITDSIYKIVTDQTEVTDSRFIKEFVHNTDKEVFQKINNHITELKKHNEMKPLLFTTTEEQQAEGAPATYEIPINFNDSDFFG